MDGKLPRPPIPVACWTAFGAWCGCVAAEVCAWSLGVVSHGWVFGACGVAVCALVAQSLRRRSHVLYLVAGSIVLGLAVGLASWWTVARDGARATHSGARWECVAVGDPAASSTGDRVRARIVAPAVLAGARVTLIVPQGMTPPEMGMAARVVGRFDPGERESPWTRIQWRRGEIGSIRVIAIAGVRQSSGLRGWAGSVRRRVGDLIDAPREAAAPGDPGRALMHGILLGDRRGLDGSPTELAFALCGLVHVLSVSGLHLAVVASSAGALGRSLRLSPRVVYIATSMLAVVYSVMTGFQGATVRSLVMLSVMGASSLFGRRGSGLGALGVTVAVMAVADPTCVFDLGLRLSVAAMGGIVAFGGWATGWLSTGLGSRGSLAETFATTLVAQATTLPLTAPLFGMVSLVAPIANILTGAPTSFALVVGLVGGCLGCVVPPVGVTVMNVGVWVLGRCADIAGMVASIPGAAVPITGDTAVGLIVGLLTVAAVWVAWPRPKTTWSARSWMAGLVAIPVVLALGMPQGSLTEITVLDVGQGDAILVQDSGAAMLVDCGPDGAVLRGALARAGVRSVGELVFTHAHADHTGGFDGLRGVVSVGAELEGAHADGTPTACRDARTTRVYAGQQWRVGRATVKVVSAGEDADSENDASVVLLVQRGAFDAVLSGDAETPVLDRLAAAHALPDVELWKVSHHGSRNGVDAAALDALRPAVAVISVGKDNTFGHPHAEALAALEAARVQVVRTDRSGDVHVTTDGRVWHVDGARGPRSPAMLCDNE